MKLLIFAHEQNLGVMLGLILAVLSNGCGAHVNSPVSTSTGNAGVHEAGFRAVVPWKGQKIAGESILEMSTDTGTVVSLDNSERTIYLTIRTSVQAYLHCYYRAPNGFVSRIFPQSRSSQSLFRAGESLILSVGSKAVSTAEAESVTNPDNTPPSFLCLAFEENIENKLPTFLAATEEIGLPDINYDNVFEIYRQTTTANLIGRSLVHYVAVQ